MIYILGDSYVDNRKNYEHAFFNQVISNFNEISYNLAKEGTGPHYTMDKFAELCEMRGFDKLNGQKFIILLSDPARENENSIHSNIEVNLKYIMYLKGLSSFVMPDAKFFINNSIISLEYDLSELNDNHFYYFRIPFGNISLNEFKDLNRFTYPNGEIKFVEDKRPNHLSKVNHDIIANIITEFFKNGKHLEIDMKYDFLTEKSDFIYE